MPLDPSTDAATALTQACKDGDGVFCALLPVKDYPAWVPIVAGAADVLVIVILILVAALIIRTIVNRLITRVTTRAGEGVLPERMRRSSSSEATTAIYTERRRQRAETMGSVLRSIASVVVLGTAALTITTRLGIPIAPLLTSVGILGVAVGFGAQELVKDFIAGIFMLMEDQYGVGDIVDTGVAIGTVEAVTLRITRLRDADGKVWYVRNGTITRVGNESQGWSRAIVDVPVAYDADISATRDLLQEVTDALWDDAEYHETVIVEEPQVYGMESISGTAVVFRVIAKTVPGRQQDIARELRLRIKKAFDEKGLAFAA